MKRALVSIISAGLAMYLFGMLYWGVSPLPYYAWQQTTDDVAAGEAMARYFPVSGTYYLPGEHHDAATKAELYEKGPVAMIHVTARDGRALHEPWVLVKGLVLKLTVAALLWLVLFLAQPDRVRRGFLLLVVVGLAGTVLIDMGDVVWWYLPFPWKAAQSIYHILSVTLAASILSTRALPRD
ncbi:hypothetical protein [Acanthopleuribacter pedis]|uniref:Transmembrane protein n=1 Tax=Acanthopleuribacter pedis TaxID=442870 RepID=A0A8J7U6E3_9BACT|nr:hypothetical protein [Acanthopleuribacter pedis]MBO1321373.1 hypothetical protein [Acanthopleuribacter pedis]